MRDERAKQKHQDISRGPLVYAPFGVRMASNLALPDLRRLRRGPVDCSFCCLSPHSPRQERDRTKWYHRLLRPDGQVMLRMGRTSRGYEMNFPKRADFSSSWDGRRICCRPKEGLAPEDLQHLLLDMVLPLTLGLRRKPVLHGSAVSIPGPKRGVLVFLGGPGAGKSTLAAYLSGNGFGLVADDGIRIQTARGRYSVFSSYPSLRLGLGAAARLLPHGKAADCGGKGKRFIRGRELGLAWPKGALPLKRIYLLAGAAERSVRLKSRSGISSPLTPKQAFLALCEHIFRLDLTEERHLRWEFEMLSRLSVSVPFRRLQFRREFNQLPQVRQTILEDLSRDA